MLALLMLAPNALWAQGGGAEGGGGLYDINTGLSAWTLIVFALLVAILGKFAWGPILKNVEAREKSIQSALDEAAQRNVEAARLLDEALWPALQHLMAMPAAERLERRYEKFRRIGRLGAEIAGAAS